MSKLFHRTAHSARRHRVVAALLGVLAVFGTAAGVYAATTPDFSVSAQPPSQTTASGSSTSYVVSISPTNGFSGNVTLTAGNLPKGTSATWTAGTTTSSGSASVTVPAGSSVAQDATLTIGGGQPPADTYNPTITATSASRSHTVTLTLIVVKQNAATFTLSVSPSAQTIAQGTITSTVSITRSEWSGQVTFGSVLNVPSGASASVSPTSTMGSAATLTITTTSSTPPGLYTLTVPGTAVLSDNSTSTRYASFTLNVLPPFPISGNLASPLSLGNGGTQSLDLAISNPYSTRLSIKNIAVALASIQLAARASGTCNQTGTNSPNFRIANLDPNYSVTVPAGATMKLSQLGTGQKPTITWLDQNWAQNGCLGATLNFTYSAAGQF